MSIENSKNYTGSEDVYRNITKLENIPMSKERELLKRALVLLEGSHYQDLVEEIRAYLAEPEEEPLNLNCKSVQKRLVTQWGYSISGKRDPLREEEIEVVAESASTELVNELVVALQDSIDLVDELVVALEYCIKKIPVFAYVPGISAALEKAKGDECV